ncbi:MAG: molybdenum cofactor biosynthesis protein MoaE [Candidatus Hadarchaeum sp.]|uniref:molybdenum cofactor biosynthesis protein MoaE n=1 Tax=Candidatus Hadarchaeum sp. TaxID=2883567 RepID=UPI003D098F27
MGIHRKGEVTLPDLLERMKTSLGKDVGAIGCFVGVIREVSTDGELVKYLHYEKAEDAMEQLEEIALDFERIPGIRRVMIHHVVDDLSPGDDAIYVLVAGVRRAEVFKALAEIMDRVKKEVFIWKEEVTEDKRRWGHEIDR